MPIDSPASPRQDPIRHAAAMGYHNRNADTQRLIHAVIEKAWIPAVACLLTLLLGAAYIRRAPVL